MVTCVQFLTLRLQCEELRSEAKTLAKARLIISTLYHHLNTSPSFKHFTII
jgi:hypothetical protein